MDSDDHAKMEKGYLEHEVDLKKDNQLLQSKLRELEFQKIELEREVKVLREKNEELELRIASVEKGRDVNSEYKGASIKNNVFQCEKKCPESEVENWKQKCKELESQLLLVQGRSGFGGKQIASIRETEELDKVADMSAAVNKVIQDGGCEGYKGLDILTPFPSVEDVPYSKASMIEGQGNEDDMSDCSEKLPFVVTAKRKRSQNVVTSDNESDYDDNIPIGQLVRKRIQGRAISECKNLSDFSPCKRHRLVKLGQYKTDGSENNDDDNDSLGDFIDSSCDVEQDLSDSSVDFDDILHRIRRSKDDVSEWELEGDMLAAFGKDPLLCMKAVCALYRRQTCDEQEIHGTFVSNGRGFSKFDAPRGTELAEFLTDGGPDGNVTKSVEQLNEFDPNGVEVCRKLAAHYSKQLFNIYKNGEYPYFFPPPH